MKVLVGRSFKQSKHDALFKPLQSILTKGLYGILSIWTSKSEHKESLKISLEAFFKLAIEFIFLQVL